MTCIIAISQDNNVFMGGDAAASEVESGMISRVNMPKVFVKDEYLVGYAGSFRMGKFIQYSVEFPKPPSWAKGKAKLDEFMNGYFIPAVRKQVEEHKLESQEKEEFGFIIGIRGHIFEIDDAWAAYEPETNYASIGSGSSVAYGSLHSTAGWSNPKKRIQVALEASEKYNIYVSSPFTILEN